MQAGDIFSNVRQPAARHGDIFLENPLVVPRANGFDLAFVLVNNVDDLRKVHAGLRTRIERALLLELSRSPEERAHASSLESVRLIAYDNIDNLNAAFVAFALKPAKLEKSVRQWLVKRLRAIIPMLDEDKLHARQVMAQPTSAAHDCEKRIADRLKAHAPAWGSTPGIYAQALGLGLDFCALDAFEAHHVSKETGVLRWIPPLCFQALCDLVGVLAVKEFGVKLSWSVAADETPELAHPPPHFRLADGRFFPVAEVLMRWCIMPLQVGEHVPSLREWIIDAFTREAR